jgi:hypothetical protein
MLISQIACVQAVFYLVLSVFILFGTIVTGDTVKLDHVLGYEDFLIGKGIGWAIFFCYIATAGVMYVHPISS